MAAVQVKMKIHKNGKRRQHCEIIMLNDIHQEKKITNVNKFLELLKMLTNINNFQQILTIITNVIKYCQILYFSKIKSINILKF